LTQVKLSPLTEEEDSLTGELTLRHQLRCQTYHPRIYQRCRTAVAAENEHGSRSRPKNVVNSRETGRCVFCAAGEGFCSANQ